MIPLVPALALAFASFLASAFVILRIIIPILPPHPLSKRVSPAEFGLPTFRKLSPADKAHIWLASLDIVALAIFIWQAVGEATGGISGFASATDPASSIRLWTILTIRQTFLLVVAAITLLHVRLGRPVSFGGKHWILWAPSLILIVASTALSGVISGAGISSLFYGLVAYNSTIAMTTIVAFSCLIGTLVVIKRNLNAINEERNPWPPVREAEGRPRPSFATEDIDALREGGSWVSSNSSTSSRHNSISAWSFSTHHTVNASSHGHGRPQTGSHHSVPVKSSYWFGAPSREDIPPVPPLPSPYGQISPGADSLADPDPFRRDTPSPLPHHPLVRLGSRSSWLTSANGSQTTVSAWSFPATQREPSVRSPSVRDVHTPSTLVSRPNTPALASAQVLGGYGYAPDEVEKGVLSLAAASDTTLEVSLTHNLGWFSLILVPYAFSLPYLVIVSQNLSSPLIVTIFFMLSITLSSPILALNVLFKCPFPIPTGLFDASTHLPPDLRGPKESTAPPMWSHDYKRSVAASVTVVEGRRSGDVWIAKGDAVDGKGKLGRAIEVLNPRPKLSVIPPMESIEPPELTPPLPIQDEDSLPVSIHNTPDTSSARFDRRRTESKASSHFSGGDESLAVASKIMIAQRHYSALAQTVVVPSTSPEKEEAKTTGAIVTKPAGHLRSRSISSVNGPSTPTPTETFRISPTPPPSFPLPPTPPSVRAARLALLSHKKSFSSGFDFGPVDDMNEIDALTAGMLPLLVPGLRVGGDVKIRDNECSPPGSYSKSKGLKMAKKMNEFGLDFSSPQVSSTPARRPRNRKQSGHRKNHYSLPSFGLGKDGIHSLAAWSADIRGAIEHKVSQYQYTAIPSNVEVGWRNTVFGAESIPNAIPHLQAVQEAEDYTWRAGTSLGRSMSARTLGLRPEVPHEIDSSRLSLLGMSAPISAASTATLFEDIEADFASGPLAESTPHNTVTEKKTRKQPPPPLPLNKTAKSRSSIVYIKSEDSAANMNVNATPPNAESTTISAMASIAQWSTRAVKPLIPKSSKIQRRISNASTLISGTKSGSPKIGLRSLALLQDRDPNTVTASPTTLSETRPLSLGKKQKSRRAAREVQDENTNPDSLRSHGSKSLKPLKLARSETSKMRGVLRQNEVLPDVVVRPPSESNHTSFAYNFHDN
ncbi:hypothetical protein P691DRAFT_700859 [Macrolepiota fuliginosa MF-IS2]|uniref:Uncharacterized protein n=1 Tax=Macrolepiota fuliginosa MF-IS2 TaxID=1400762 RepID=A0A9P6C6U2_9AGAR|nr:hypothetical protein P691DRAFT_700859 [Macrolepiota fuliginosa MF-IS2]